METYSNEKPSYDFERIIFFILEIESIKLVLPKIFNPDTAVEEIENISNEFPPEYIQIFENASEADSQSIAKMNTRKEEKISNYIRKSIEITGEKKLQSFQRVLCSQLIHKFIAKNREMSSVFLQKEMIGKGSLQFESELPKNINQLSTVNQDLLLGFIRKIPKDEMFDLFRQFDIFFYTDIFVNTKYEGDKFISTLEQEFIKSQLLFFNKIFGNLSEVQKRRLPSLQISPERSILQGNTDIK